MIHNCPQHCVARHSRCHIDCPQYAKLREEYEQERKKRHKEIAVKCYQADQKVKALEITRRHKTWRRSKSKR